MPAVAVPVTPPSVIGAIDVGSSGIRMQLARVEEGRFAIVESLSRAVPLGIDAFRRGHLSRATMDATVATLRNFQKVLALHQVDRLRAVATSALREVDNADLLIERILQATGIEVQIIDGAEENRLNFLAVEHGLRGSIDMAGPKAAIIEVGGGSLDITLLKDGAPVSSESQPMGSVRIMEAGRLVGMSQARFVARLRRAIRSSVAKFERNLPLGDVTLFVALGSEMRLVADRVGLEVAPHIARIPGESFRAFVKEAVGRDVEAITALHRIAPADAERFLPTLLTYAELLAHTAAAELIVPRVSLRDGLIVDLAGLSGSTALRNQVLSSALTLGRKYGFDEGHGSVVAGLATQIFDGLSTEHGLGARERLLLEVASLLHDVGLFIGSRSHHKHSQYIIAASEIFGLGVDEHDIVANVARYHRRAQPQKTHPSFMGLGRKYRATVNKLAAILRIADALDREHGGRIKTATVTRTEEGFDVAVPLSQGELEGEIAAFDAKKELFVEVFGSVALRGTAS